MTTSIGKIAKGFLVRPLWLSRLSYSALEKPHIQQDASSRPWKPATLRAPLLSIMIAFPLVLVVVFEILSRQSQQNGGIVFAERELSGLAQFSYQYLPTILVVSYSMFWAWIDLDTKRLEPYFQMSKSTGSVAAQSILLHYPFDLVIIPPIKAFRHRHWAVVITGLISGLIFCGITPLAGAIFEKSQVTHWAMENVSLAASFSAATDKVPSLTNGFLLSSYSTLWLNQFLPSFTTDSGALRPLVVEQQGQLSSIPSIWTVSTDMYSSSLSCQQAATQDNPQGVLYTDGLGCTIQDRIISATIPNVTSLFASFYQTNCNSSNSSPQIFVAFSFSNQPPLPDMKTLNPPIQSYEADESDDLQGEPQDNVSLRWSSFWKKTVLFCRPSYNVQVVNATILAPNMTVTNTRPLGSSQELNSELFNASDFEARISGTSSLPDTFRRDINESIQYVDATQIENLGIKDVIGNMMVFAVGSDRLKNSSPMDVDMYLNASVLEASLGKAYKLLFALAVNSLLNRSSTSSDTTLRTSLNQRNTITVVRHLSIVVEVLLSLISIMSILLLAICWNRPNHMKEDPDSLNNLLSLTGNDPKIPTTARGVLENHEKPILSLRDGKIYGSTRKQTNTSPTGPSMFEAPRGINGDTKPVYPYVTRSAAGISLLTFLSLALIIVAALWFSIRNHNGLSIPSGRPVVNQILLNYLPVIFATLLEPYWTILNRKLCILKPFEALRNCQARASQSLHLQYTSLPPQLIISRAFRARHFLLVTVCAIGLSANILAVALNALLKTQIRVVESSCTFSKLFEPFVEPLPSDISSSDSLYIAAANFSHGTPLPAWVVPDLFFLPFQSNLTSALGSVRSYKAVTPGFGLSINCTSLEWDHPGWIAEPDSEIGTPQINLNQSDVECMRSWSTFYESPDPAVPTNGSLDLIASLDPSYPRPMPEQHSVCGNMIVAGLLRAQLNAETEGVDTLVTSSQWMTCKSNLVVALYEVEVDKTGHVQSYYRKSENSNDISFVGNATSNLTMLSLYSALGPLFSDTAYWRDGTYSNTWLGFLLKSLTNSTTLIDPSIAVPTFYEASAAVEQVLVRLFPIILSLRPNAFAAASPDSTIKGTMIIACNRVYMSQPMFIVVMVLLLLNILVASAYYIYRPRPMPSNIGDTIASVLALFDGSGLVREQQVNGLWPVNWKFGFGKFIGREDGKPKLGIERKPFVVPFSDD